MHIKFCLCKQWHYYVHCHCLMVFFLSSLQYGTIRFGGTTEFASGQYAGIVLDEEIGKNDGSYGGIRYFTCKPKYGKCSCGFLLPLLPQLLWMSHTSFPPLFFFSFSLSSTLSSQFCFQSSFSGPSPSPLFPPPIPFRSPLPSCFSSLFSSSLCPLSSPIPLHSPLPSALSPPSSFSRPLCPDAPHLQSSPTVSKQNKKTKRKEGFSLHHKQGHRSSITDTDEHRLAGII